LLFSLLQWPWFQSIVHEVGPLGHRQFAHKAVQMERTWNYSVELPFMQRVVAQCSGHNLIEILLLSSLAKTSTRHCMFQPHYCIVHDIGIL
jgi:hypothetical protein